MELKLNKQIVDGVNLYCSKNNIDNLEEFIYQCFKQGYDIKKYGLLGEPLNEGEKHLKTSGIEEKWEEKEVIVEKRVEIPVEVIKEVIVEKEIIKEVEKIVEVPVEKVVTKIEYISDKTTEDELGGIIAKLKNEMSKKDEELDEVRRNLDIFRQKLDENNDDEKLKMLSETLQKLRKELNEKNERIKNLEKINQDLQNTKQPLKGFFMRGSNLNDTL
jgi:predicted RNase H-like nuclease (RuvC/YqgF family)